MRVPRRDIAFLRAHLRDRWFRSLLLTLTMPPWRKITIATAAFNLAVYRRFAGKTRADVILFVAHARIRYGPGGPNKLEPGPCEHLIISALTGTRPEGLTKWQRAKSLILLNELIQDEQLTEDQLEEFIAEAVRLASNWTRPGRHGRTSG